MTTVHAGDLLSVMEVARIMNISPRTVTKYRQDGLLPYVRYSRKKVLYRRADINTFISSSYNNAHDYLL